jgi:predicted amino acid dehydrogenase
MSPGIAEQMPSVTFCPGAVVQLPHRERIDIPGFPLPPGYTYGCMAEGLLLGLEGVQPGRWGGRSSPTQVSIMTQIAARHGFLVAGSAVDWRPAEPT